MSSDEQYAETVGKRMTEFPIERRDLLQATGAGLLGTVGVGAAQTTGTQETSGGDLIWEFTQPSKEVFSSPTVADGTVYVGSEDSNLYAVDAATGDQEWAFTQLSGAVLSSPTVVDDTVFIGSYVLYAVDAATGTQEWAFAQPADIYSSPTAADGTVYVGSLFPDYTLYAVDAATGTQEWAFTQPSADVYSSPTVADGTVYVGAYDNTLYAVDAATGTQEWAFTQPSDHVYSSPTVADGTVYVGSSEGFGDGALYAVDAATGEQEWAFTQPSDWVSSSPTVADGTVYVGSDDNTLYAVDAATGTQEWAFTQPSGDVNSSPTVADGTVYVGSRDDTLYAVDAATGSQEWAFTQPSDEVFSSPTVADGTVYVGSDDNTLYAVDAGVEGSSEGSRVLLRTLGHHDENIEQPPDPDPTGTVAGQVTDEADDSLADATVEFVPTGADTPEQTTTTNDSGNYEVELPADTTYDVTASKSGYVSETAEVTVEQNTTQTVDFTLLGTGTVTGQVTDEAGDSLADATVEFVPTGADTPEQTTTTNDSGNYEVELPADTTYDVTASKSGYVSETAEVTVEQNTTQTVDFTLLGTGTVTGQVTDEAGDSLANVTIECVPTGTDTAEKTVTTDDSGTYDAKLPTDSYELTATREEYVSETAEVTVEQNTTQTVDFILSELDSLDQLVQTKLDRAETIDSWSLALAEYDDVEPLLGSIQTAVDNGTLDEAPAEEAVQRLLYGEAATTRSLQLVGPDSTPPVPDLDLTKETVRLLFDIGVSIALSYLALKKRLLQRLDIIDPGAIDNLDPQDVDKLLDIIEGINFTKTMQALANLMLPEKKAQEAVAEFKSIAEDIITDIDAGLLESGEEIKNAIEDAYEGTLEIFAAPLRIIFETGERPLSVTDRPGLNSHLDELHQAFTVEDIQSGLQGDREGAAQGLIEGKEDILTRAQNMNNWITGLDEVADKTTLLGNIPPILNWLAELGQGGQEQQVTPNVAVSAVIAAVVTIEKVLQVIGFAIQGAGAVIGLYGLERMQSRHGITIDAVVEGDPNQFIPPFDTDQGTASVGSLDWQGGDGV